MAAPEVPAVTAGTRLVHLDWLRGVAVVIMITSHALDAWTAPADRGRPLYGWSLIVAGGGSTLFLFLAGVASTLAAGIRSRRLSSSAAAASVRKRGWQIFLYAFLFRLQSFLLSPGSSLLGLLKVDVLNVMGPSIAAVATIWQAARSPGFRILWLSALTVALALVTPLVRSAAWPAALPDPIEWYLRPSPGWTNFTLLPWAGFVTAGGAVGVWLDRAAVGDRQPRAHLELLAAGAALALGGWAASHLPTVLPGSSFWTSSPSYFCLRVGILTLSVAAAFAWARARGPAIARGPMCRLGLSSLFVYWIHVEMVYGVLSAPLHRRLPLAVVLVAIAAFTGLMLAAVALKDSTLRWWRRRGRPQPQRPRA